MHELSLIADLVRKIILVAGAHGAVKVISATLQLGALCHLSVDHVRKHFAHAAQGTVAEGAVLQIEILTDIRDPHAQEIILKSVEVEEQGEDH